MASYEENKRFLDSFRGAASASTKTFEQDDFFIDKNVTLKKDDLKQRNN